MCGCNTFLQSLIIVIVLLSSMIEAKNECLEPLMITNMESVTVIRKEPYTTVSRPPYVKGDIAIYRCSGGYSIADPESEVICRSSGEWSRKPECVVTNCQPRDEAAAKAANRLCRKRSCFPGDGVCKNTRVCVCDYECGFTCIRPDNYCFPPQNISNMKSYQVLRANESGHLVPVLEPYEYDDAVEYKCKIGFRLERKDIKHRCHGRRRWTGTPECLRACKPYSAVGVKANNMICGVKCKTDDECIGTSQCLCDGHCGRRCVNPNVECGAAPMSDNAFIEYTGRGIDRVANYICQEGFYISAGTPSRKCTGGGTWDGRLISCQRVQCDDPSRAIEDQQGEVLDWQPGPHYPGRQFTFRCRPSYRLLGSSKRTCMNNGRWSGVDTACDKNDELVRCPNPGVPINGRLLTRNSFTRGTFVKFSCDEGFAMVGEMRQECLYFLQWSDGGAPQCINPKYPDDTAQTFNKLQRNVNAIQATIPSAGRFISSSFKAGHEIYFLFDLSESVQDSELDNALTFAIKLIERLSVNATGTVEYGIIVFASNPKVILDTQLRQPPPEEVIQLLNDIEDDRPNIQEEIFRGTHTALALRELGRQLAFSYSQDKKRARKRHVFILTDGLHNEGPPPQQMIKRFTLEYQENVPEFYSITSCVECYEKSEARPGRSTSAYTELLGLANNNRENFILIPNFYSIQDVLDQVTNATIDFGKCGRAGDIGSVKRQASAGRVVNGVQASERSWPWQVSVMFLYQTILNTFNLGFLGGGSIINNRWVLTAAHLFVGLRPDEFNNLDANWTRSIGVVYGLHKRPLVRRDILPQKTKVFDAAEIIIHNKFSSDKYDSDIALIRIGNELEQNGFTWVRIGYVGFVNYTEYISPVCLPCMEGNCVREHLRNTGELTGSETDEKRCEIEGNFLFNSGGAQTNPLVVTGFGHQEEKETDEEAQLAEYLQQGLIKLENNERCNQTTREDIPWKEGSSIDFTETMICGTSGQVGENIDSCQGDSGGPLVKEVFCDDSTKDSQWVQVGIVSWGWGCGLSVTRQQEMRQLPGFYSNVVKLMPWVKEKLKTNGGL